VLGAQDLKVLPLLVQVAGLKVTADDDSETLKTACHFLKRPGERVGRGLSVQADFSQHTLSLCHANLASAALRLTQPVGPRAVCLSFPLVPACIAAARLYLLAATAGAAARGDTHLWVLPSLHRGVTRGAVRRARTAGRTDCPYGAVSASDGNGPENLGSGCAPMHDGSDTRFYNPAGWAARNHQARRCTRHRPAAAIQSKSWNTPPAGEVREHPQLGTYGGTPETEHGKTPSDAPDQPSLDTRVGPARAARAASISASSPVWSSRSDDGSAPVGGVRAGCRGCGALIFAMSSSVKKMPFTE